MARNRAEAEDLTQEAFLQLYRKIHTFRGEAAFTTWLHRLAANVMFTHLRNKHPEVSLEEVLDPEDEDRPRKDIGVFHNALIRSNDRVDIWAALDTLPRNQRHIVILHAIDGNEHDEIGKKMGISTRDSRSQYHEARMKMRDYIDPESAHARARLMNAVKALPSGYQSVYVLREIEKYKLEEIAVILGRTIGCVKSQYHKATLKLAKLLASPEPGQSNGSTRAPSGGQRIRVEREKRGWTQGDLGEMVGVSRAYVGMLESSRRIPDNETVRRVAVAFGFEPSYFVKDRPAPDGNQ